MSIVGFEEILRLTLAQVGSGRIQGGWGYVTASYVIAYGVLALYAVSLWLRTRSVQAQKRENR
jgi:hypothetical protein